MQKKAALGALCLMLTTLVFSQYKEEYVQQYREIAISEMHRTGIPASIKLSQAILESNYGRSELAREAHNHFGIKCGKDWGGRGYHLKDDDRDPQGELVNSCFRVYKSPEESYIEHSEFLSDPAKAHRYGSLFSLAPDDYKGWAEGLKRAGYATSPEYARVLIRIIEEQHLYQYDVRQVDDDLARRKSRRKEELEQPDVNQEIFRREKYVIQFQNDIPYIEARRGDNVKTVSRQTDVAAGRIIKYNEFVENRRTQLQEGDRIYLQPLKRKYHGTQTTHLVEPGEDLAAIAHYYGIKSDVLRTRNDLPEGCEPSPGSRIVLRGKQKKKIPCASEEAILAEVSSPKVTAHQSAAKPSATTSKITSTKGTTSTGTEKTETQIQRASVPGLSDDFVREVLSYTVQPRDTLYQIAARHGITVQELKEMNNLSGDVIHPGQELKVWK